MRKRLLCVLIAWAGCLVTAHAQEVAGPLDRQIPGGWSYESFDDALRQIEQKTGFKVVCPKELEAFMQTIWMKESVSAYAETMAVQREARRQGAGMERGVPADTEANVSVRTFLDHLCGDLSLRWRFEAKDNTLSVEPAWQTADPRTPVELLKAVCQPDSGASREADPKWQAAFDALLSKETNFDKAWRVRQKSVFQSMFRFFGSQLSKPVLINEIVDSEGAKYVLVVNSHPMEMSPGHGSVSYYWFGADGVLAGAGLMNTGHRCTLVDVTIGNQPDRNANKPRSFR